jgi:hypothetical protein
MLRCSTGADVGNLQEFRLRVTSRFGHSLTIPVAVAQNDNLGSTWHFQVFWKFVENSPPDPLKDHETVAVCVLPDRIGKLWGGVGKPPQYNTSWQANPFPVTRESTSWDWSLSWNRALSGSSHSQRRNADFLCSSFGCLRLRLLGDSCAR